MKKTIVVEAESIKDAIAVALKKLQTTKDRVAVEILREEKKGLFGMCGSKFAKIRVSVKKSV